MTRRLADFGTLHMQSNHTLSLLLATMHREIKSIFQLNWTNKIKKMQIPSKSPEWWLMSAAQNKVRLFIIYPKAKSTHYSKSQIFVQKFNFDQTPTFSRVFHPNFFWQIFSWHQSCQQLKRPKPQHFHEFFT